jgi:hypothetical protein
LHSAPDRHADKRRCLRQEESARGVAGAPKCSAITRIAAKPAHPPSPSVRTPTPTPPCAQVSSSDQPQKDC